MEQLMYESLKKEITDNLQQLLDSLSVIVAIYSPEGRVVVVNKALCDLHKIKPEDWIGKTVNQLVIEGYIDKTVVDNAIKTRKEVYGIVKTRSGTEGLSHCRPILNEQGELKFLVVTSTVFSELSELKIKLEKERYKAEQYLREIEHLRKGLLIGTDVVFESSHMQSILEDVKKISTTDCTILITGESGVGKEVIAKTIHMNSLRREKPFIPISIPAIPENLLESELFGYKEGAFTGSARGGKIGLFEIAQDGTLFLDEVGDIPYNIQVKILRAIETGEITRVGGLKPQHFNIRIISATNKDMESEISKGTFREDLYYRLSVFPLKIKPLRERHEDIHPMAQYFLANINKKYKTNKRLTDEALKKLELYAWPGNVRELRNVIERLIILSRFDNITAEEVIAILGSHSIRESPSPKIWKEYLTHERALILSALKQAEGNKSKAAKILKMPRSKFYRRLQRLDV
jgi:transcriptional regulator with PAS, ATPase and Fis domain